MPLTYSPIDGLTKSLSRTCTTVVESAYCEKVKRFLHALLSPRMGEERFGPDGLSALLGRMPAGT